MTYDVREVPSVILSVTEVCMSNSEIGMLAHLSNDCRFTGFYTAILGTQSIWRVGVHWEKDAWNVRP